MSDNILASGREKKSYLNRFCERLINKEERKRRVRNASRVFILRPVRQI